MARRSRRQNPPPESEYVVGIDPYRQLGWRYSIPYPRTLPEAAVISFDVGFDPHRVDDALIDRMNVFQRQYDEAMQQVRQMTMVQRDLEDQIAEELQQRQMSGSTQSGPEPAPRSERPKIKISEVITLLSQGYTRFEKDDKGFGSVQKKFGLTHSQTQQLFQHEALKGLKTKTPSIEIIDDRPPARPASTTSSTTTTSTTTNNPFD